MLVLGAISLVGVLRWIRHGVPAEGRIIAVHDNGRALVPEVRYEAQGRQYTIRANLERTSRSRPQYAVGDSLPVLYDPDRPDWGIISSAGELWLLPILLGAPGLVFSLVTSVVLWKQVRATRAAATGSGSP